MLMETLRAELKRVAGNISRARWRRARAWLHLETETVTELNEEIRMWKRYRRQLRGGK